jgi:hypothetical protein
MKWKNKEEEEEEVVLNERDTLCSFPIHYKNKLSLSLSLNVLWIPFLLPFDGWDCGEIVCVSYTKHKVT